jgi:hypothetical protein
MSMGVALESQRYVRGTHFLVLARLLGAGQGVMC